MDKNQLENIRYLATQFRQACEEYAWRTDDPCFHQFPKFCCGYASEMLECYLTQNSFNNLKHVIGTKPYSQSTHAWTKIDADLIIDITLDQFSPTAPSVYIGKLHPIHKEFGDMEERDSEAEIGNIAVDFFYTAILLILKKHST